MDKLSTGGSPVHGLTRLLSWWLPLYDPRRVRASVGCLRGPQDGHATLACAGIAVRYLGRSKFDARTIPRLVRNLRSERIDILHLHGFGGSTIGRLVGWITGIPCIVHEHVCKAEIPTHQRLADRLLRSRTAAAIAASGAVADFLAEKRFIPPDAIQVVHGGVPARLFRAPAKRGWRRKLGVAEDCRIVATVGRLHAAKGHTHFLEAARQVLDAVERVVFLIVGDGELLDELRQQAASLDLEKHVLFTGHIDEIPSLLAEVDIVAISSTSEGGPITLYEAMAAGRAIVASSVGAVPDVLEDSVSGYIVPPGDARTLAARCTRLLQDGALRERLAERALAEAHRYDVSNAVRAFELLYARVSGTRG